jgi:hypothetical protein
MEYKDWVIGFLGILVIFVAMNSFFTGLAGHYGYESSYMEDPTLNITGFKQQADSIDTKKWEEAFREEGLTITLGVIALQSVWGIIKLMFVFPIAMFYLITRGSFMVLNVPTLIIGMLLNALIIYLIVGAWKLIKNP